ncbi:hypothetical protein MMC30_002999 [Trapelia coarctata]|nr:hypothetical protein [Trapelia coarctata]
MVELEPIRTAASNKSKARSSPRSQSSQGRTPNLTHIYSAQHLDDQSCYHHDWRTGDDPDGEDSGQTTVDESEKGSGELEQDEQHDRTATANKGDLEAGGALLEKKKTSRSAKDPGDSPSSKRTTGLDKGNEGRCRSVKAQRLEGPIVIDNFDDTADTANDTADHDPPSKKSKGLNLPFTKSVSKLQFRRLFAD